MNPFVAVLFARSDSIYYQLTGCDVYDIDRDALTFAGGLPVIAHPPCRTWGMLAHMAHKARPGEKELAPWAVERVREETGFVEHPAGSRLWKHCGCPPPDGITQDFWGGRCIRINQVEWGHKALKPTILYGVGVDFSLLIPPFSERKPTHNVCGGGKNGLPGFGGRCKKDAEGTPEPLARQLVSLMKPPFLGREPTHQIGGSRSRKNKEHLINMTGGEAPKEREATPQLLAAHLVQVIKEART